MATDREAFEVWYDAQPDGRLEPFDVWQAAIAYAAQSGHACTFALDGGGNIYRRYREPQCAAGVPVTVPVGRPATGAEAQHAAEIGACLPNGVMFDAFGRTRERYVRVSLDGSHLILHPSELDAFKAGEENPDQFTYSDVYLSEEEADALPEFDGF